MPVSKWQPYQTTTVYDSRLYWVATWLAEKHSSHWAVPSHSALVCSLLFHRKRPLVVKNPKVFAAHGFLWHDVDFQDGWKINVENDTARWLPVLQLVGWWISLHILRSFGIWGYQYSPYWRPRTLQQSPQWQYILFAEVTEDLQILNRQVWWVPCGCHDVYCGYITWQFNRKPLNKHDDGKPQGRSAPLFCGWVV